MPLFSFSLKFSMAFYITAALVPSVSEDITTNQETMIQNSRFFIPGSLISIIPRFFLEKFFDRISTSNRSLRLWNHPHFLFHIFVCLKINSFLSVSMTFMVPIQLRSTFILYCSFDVELICRYCFQKPQRLISNSIS